MKQTATGLDLYLSNKAEFQYFAHGNLWYKTTAGSFLFPIALDANSTRRFNRIEKAVDMREFIVDWFNLVG